MRLPIRMTNRSLVKSIFCAEIGTRSPQNGPILIFKTDSIKRPGKKNTVAAVLSKSSKFYNICIF